MKLKIEDNNLVKISEDTWSYKIDCFSGILYYSKTDKEEIYNVNIFAKSTLLESCSCPTFNEAKSMLIEGVRAWSEISGTLK